MYKQRAKRPKKNGLSCAVFLPQSLIFTLNLPRVSVRDFQCFCDANDARRHLHCLSQTAGNLLQGNQHSFTGELSERGGGTRREREREKERERDVCAEKLPLLYWALFKYHPPPSPLSSLLSLLFILFFLNTHRHENPHKQKCSVC